jgi:ATP synthase protein I
MAGQPPDEESAFVREVAAKAVRKLRAQREEKQGVWFGLGMSGLVGWSVAVPTLGGALFGLWLDEHHPGTRSWTLMLLVAGLVLGCANAWHWIAQQDQFMQEKAEQARPEENDE